MTKGPALPRDDATAAAPPAGPGAARSRSSTRRGRCAAAQGRDDLSAGLDGRRRADGPDRHRRLRRRRVQEGQERTHQRAARDAGLPGRRRPRDDDGHRRPLRRCADAPSSADARRGELIVEAIPSDEVGGWVAERDGHEARRGVEVVEVGLPDPFLRAGDRPGRHARGRRPERGPCRRDPGLPAVGRRPRVRDRCLRRAVGARSWRSWPAPGRPARRSSSRSRKVDIYPEWRRIIGIDAGSPRGDRASTTSRSG